jgi:hypothetical protein
MVMDKREAGRLLCDFLAGRKIAEAGLGKLSPADWENLADRALRFKIEALFYREIKSRDFPAELIPDHVRKKFRQAYRNLATANTGLFFDALKVLKSLAENQLPVIALKGFGLAKSIYGDIALRPMYDIDLLLKEEDLVRAGRILLALGYKQDFPAWESMLKTYHHLPPFTNKNGTIIELHWNIVTPDSPIKVDIDGLWERASFIKIDHAEVQVFSPEDLFLHLCIHACFHLQTELDLIPFCDMAGLIKTSADKIDWQIVIARASRWGAKKCLYLMLLLVQELLGAAPSPQIMSEIKPDDYQAAFFEEALEQFFNEKPSGQLIRRRIGKLAKIKKINGIKGKVSAFLRGAFPSRAYMARIYPISVSSPKIYLCYLFRLGRLFVYYTKALIRLFRNDRSVIQAVDQEQRANAVSDWMFS